ncbi:MAG: sensor histidine kinase [Ilumatobacter sp.]
MGATPPLAVAGLAALGAGFTGGVIALVCSVVAVVAIVVSVVMLNRVGNDSAKRLDAAVNAAHHMSAVQMPQLVAAARDGDAAEPIQLYAIQDLSPDEIGRLARELDTAQDRLGEFQTVQTGSVEKGVSKIFTTLARRNRSLVDRQLALLDELEADVDDPDVLAEYYKLDHLATRMRRNAESLLVLGRAETRRRRSDPVAIDDVIRAGISEIEDYQRAQPLTIDDAAVVGPVVGDLAHMLAELLDNAAAFSPPESDVTISGAVVDSGYVVTIRDTGIGLTADRLHELNQNLAAPPSIGLRVEQTLGLSVVALLSQKHNARVELHPGGDAGTMVTIFLPANLFATQDLWPADQVAADQMEDELRELIEAERNPYDARTLPRPIPSQAVASPPAPPPPATLLPAQQAPIGPAPAPAPAEPIQTGLPARTPGAATPQMDAADTRDVPGEAFMPAATEPLTQPTIESSSGWGTAIESLAASAKTADPLPKLVLPTRSPGASAQVDDDVMPAAQGAVDPEALRSKLNSFRSMSNVAADQPVDSIVAPAPTNGDN